MYCKLVRNDLTTRGGAVFMPGTRVWGSQLDKWGCHVPRTKSGLPELCNHGIHYYPNELTAALVMGQHVNVDYKVMLSCSPVGNTIYTTEKMVSEGVDVGQFITPAVYDGVKVFQLVLAAYIRYYRFLEQHPKVVRPEGAAPTPLFRGSDKYRFPKAHFKVDDWEEDILSFGNMKSARWKKVTKRAHAMLTPDGISYMENTRNLLNQIRKQKMTPIITLGGEMAKCPVVTCDGKTFGWSSICNEFHHYLGHIATLTRGAVPLHADMKRRWTNSVAFMNEMAYDDEQVKRAILSYRRSAGLRDDSLDRPHPKSLVVLS